MYRFNNYIEKRCLQVEVISDARHEQWIVRFLDV